MAVKKKSAFKKCLKKSGPNCDCIAKINVAIARDIHPNLKLRTGYNLLTGVHSVVLPIEKKEEGIKIPPKHNVKTMTASYCPFCGKKYTP